jgi:hypothetical protein
MFRLRPCRNGSYLLGALRPQAKHPAFKFSNGSEDMERQTVSIRDVAATDFDADFQQPSVNRHAVRPPVGFEHRLRSMCSKPL